MGLCQRREDQQLWIPMLENGKTKAGMYRIWVIAAAIFIDYSLESRTPPTRQQMASEPDSGKR